MITVFFVTILSSIAFFFANEWANLVKRIAAIPGVKLLLPLVTLTTLITINETRVAFTLRYVEYFLALCIRDLGKVLSVQLAMILLLLTLTLVPTFILDRQAKRKIYLDRNHSTVSGIIIFLLLTVLMVG